jgi:hypothetical protein
MAASERSLEVAKRIRITLKDWSVFNQHPKIMGDMRNGRFKYLFKFAIKPDHLS